MDTSTADLDLIVVGSGIAGLTAAITASERGHRVMLLTKGRLGESNSRYAQGGLAAAVGPEDSPELHWEDTINCGAGLNDTDAVHALTAEAQAGVERLSSLGVSFDDSSGKLDLGREAAHSVARIVHAGDATGASIQRGLIDAVTAREVAVLEYAFVTELIVQDGRVVGAVAIHNGETMTLRADRVLLATGGAGRLYDRTTNPAIATGDGVALAFRAGAQLMDLEFFQFHPTAIAIPRTPAFLISEAARGEGGVLRNDAGDAFMRRYHHDGDLAPRDIVSRAIWSEMGRTGADRVFLDLTHLGGKRLAERFPTIVKACHEFGIDPALQALPVAPAAHYFMGGIRADIDGRTSVPGLLAAGEVACTGVHGANRLASNSLLEGLVVGGRSAMASADETVAPVVLSRAVDVPADGVPAPLIRSQLGQRNWRDIGIVRSAQGLERAAHTLTKTIVPFNQVEWEDANLGLLSRLVANAALTRTESRGAHFRSDFPDSRETWCGHIVVQRDSSGTDSCGFMPIEAPALERIPA